MRVRGVCVEQSKGTGYEQTGFLTDGVMQCYVVLCMQRRIANEVTEKLYSFLKGYVQVHKST